MLKDNSQLAILGSYFVYLPLYFSDFIHFDDFRIRDNWPLIGLKTIEIKMLIPEIVTLNSHFTNFV